MKIKNILVPIDFSQCSKNALKVAIDLAKRFDAKIHMVNAVHIHHPHPDFVGGSLIDSIMMDYEEQVKESFNELESEIIELADVPHEADRFVSYLTDAIYSETEQKDIDLIIMGTRADHDKIEHLVGTRASDIVESSKVPVIVIPEQTTTFNPKKIGFASDLQEVKNRQKLEFINQLAASFKASILVFSVVEDPEKLTAEEQKHLTEVTNFFKENDCSARTVESKSVTQGIMNFAKTHELDMLAMVPRHRSFFQKLFTTSITKNIVIDLEIPMLSFRE